MGLFKKKNTGPMEIEVSDKNVKLRAVAVILLICVGVGCIAYFIHALVTKEPGWYTIEVESGHTEINDEVIFNYQIGQGELSAADEYKAVSTLYTAEANRVYTLFDVFQSDSSTVNLHEINQNPGKTLTVDPILYNAFRLMEAKGSRIHYMAPVFSAYRNLFSCQTEAQAKLCDPRFDEETKAHLAEAAAYAQNPNVVQLELLGNNQVRLDVSAEYQRFLEENGVTEILDFGWLTNAFVVDHIASALQSNGFTKGNITSFDGFTRNLDASGEQYAFNIFDRVGKNVYPAATAHYRKSISVVFLRDYPLSTQDAAVYFTYSDGSFATRYADPKTGLYKSALPNLVSYSYDQSCAEIAMSMAKVFMADTFDEYEVQRMTEGDGKIYSIWIEESTVCYNDAAMTIHDLYTDDTVTYKSEARLPAAGK